jgi:hypothetical protein
MTLAIRCGLFWPAAVIEGTAEWINIPLYRLLDHVGADEAVTPVWNGLHLRLLSVMPVLALLELYAANTDPDYHASRFTNVRARIVVYYLAGIAVDGLLYKTIGIPA